MSTTDQYREWDAAYVLGSLSPAERREYEQHLTLCEECSAAVSSLAGLSGPLAGLSHAEAYALLDNSSEPVRPPDLLPGLLERAERARQQSKRRSRWRTAAVAVAAAAAAVLMALAVSWEASVAPVPQSPSMTAMQKVAPSPISAEARLVSGPWGTRIEGECWYTDKPGSGGKSYEYLMYVIDRRGKAREIGSWMAGPGSTYSFAETTSLPREDIARVEIHGVYDGEKITVLTLP